MVTSANQKYLIFIYFYFFESMDAILIANYWLIKGTQ